MGRKPAPPAPAPAAAPPAPMQQQSSGGGMLSGIGSTIAQGMAFGTGSAIAHRAVGAVAGSFGGGDSNAAEPTTGAPVEQVQQQQMDNACIDEKKMFYDCLNVNSRHVPSLWIWLKIANVTSNKCTVRLYTLKL